MTLTPRQSEVLQLAARGLTDKEMADQLGISSRGVQFHVTNLYRKIGMYGKGGHAPLIIYAYEQGIVKPKWSATN